MEHGGLFQVASARRQCLHILDCEGGVHWRLISGRRRRKDPEAELGSAANKRLDPLGKMHDGQVELVGGIGTVYQRESHVVHAGGAKGPTVDIWVIGIR